MNNYSDNAKQEIKKWEQEGPGWIAQVGDWILWPAQKTAELLIPAGVEEAVGKAIEGFLLGLSNASLFTVSETGIRAEVQTRLGTDSEMWHKLKAADEQAQYCWNWNVGYATTEGGLTGTLGIFGLAADIPLLFTIALRLIQEIGICYGYDVNKPEEKDYIMHILRTASAGDIKAKLEFLIMLKQLEEILLKVAWKKMAAELAAKQISRLSLLAAAKQFAKSLGVQLTKRKALQMVPVIGALVGGALVGHVQPW